MIDWHTLQIELPPTTAITAQCKAAASSDERSKQPFVHPDPQWQLRAQTQSLYSPVGSAISGHCIIAPDMADVLGSSDYPLLVTWMGLVARHSGQRCGLLGAVAPSEPV